MLLRTPYHAPNITPSNCIHDLNNHSIVLLSGPRQRGRGDSQSKGLWLEVAHTVRMLVCVM